MLARLSSAPSIDFTALENNISAQRKLHELLERAHDAQFFFPKHKYTQCAVALSQYFRNLFLIPSPVQNVIQTWVLFSAEMDLQIFEI
jgi:hypothetical protein